MTTILFASNTAHAWTDAWCVQHSSTAAIVHSWTQLITKDLGSLQQSEYELVVNKIATLLSSHHTDTTTVSHYFSRGVTPH